MQFINKYRKK